MAFLLYASECVSPNLHSTKMLSHNFPTTNNFKSSYFFFQIKKKKKKKKKRARGETHISTKETISSVCFAFLARMMKLYIYFESFFFFWLQNIKTKSPPTKKVHKSNFFFEIQFLLSWMLFLEEETEGRLAAQASHLKEPIWHYFKKLVHFQMI